MWTWKENARSLVGGMALPWWAGGREGTAIQWGACGGTIFGRF